MPSQPKSSGHLKSSAGPTTDVSDVVGYLNFSNGRPDARFETRLNDLFSVTPLTLRTAADVRDQLLRSIAELTARSETFSDVTQADAVVRLAFDDLLPAYQRHHADLLFHLPASEFEQPFFVARLFEAILEQGPPWTEKSRILDGALDRLNDFVGHRPVAVLENKQRMEPYPHERFRPLPLYIQGAGAASGRYHDLVARTIEFFSETPADILQESYFDLSQLEELSLDLRAHDHLHPVNKCTNYMFGEWDPAIIDIKGRYRRFVLRKIIVDALLHWMASQAGVPEEEVLFDASAVLCGTMLMASSVSGAGPGSFDSNVTLSSLLPRVARQRDAFYERLLKTSKGARGRRLNEQAKLTRQPFGHVRQQLNIELANFGARQVQNRSIAQIYARLGQADAARAQAAMIPSASVRFETEIQWRLATAHRLLDQRDLASAAPFAEELESLLRRGIECGALVDPWNVLGFQGQFPLFQSREDSLPDQRVEVLLDLVEGMFGVFSRLLNEAAAQGRTDLHEALSARYRRLAEQWDRYATTTVEDLPKVNGKESYESAQHVSKALAEWRNAGESAGALSFWRQHVAEFQSAKSYALVVEALLQRHDSVASMGLLMQWLSHAEEVGFESGPQSFYALLSRWMDVTIASGQAIGDRGSLSLQFRRLFDHLEANAGMFWSAPTLEEGLGMPRPATTEEQPFEAESSEAEKEWLQDDDDDEDLFEAAWDDVIWKDSADDGNIGETLDEHVPGAQNTEFELLARQLEPRLRFLNTVADLWQRASIVVAGQGLANFPRTTESRGVPLPEAIANWRRRASVLQTELGRLLTAIRDYQVSRSSGDFESNLEFDAQHQTKLFLLHTVISTIVSLRMAERYLACCLEEPENEAKRRETRLEPLLLEVSRAIFQRDSGHVRRRLPDLYRVLSGKPLLYVSLENGGDPAQVLEARTLQTSLRFLLAQLPSLGLLAETWRLLFTAFRMERKTPPRGQAVTEFDRLFRIGLRGVLDATCRSSQVWQAPLPARTRRGSRLRCRQLLKAPRKARLGPLPAIRRATCRKLPRPSDQRAGLRLPRASRPGLDRLPKWFQSLERIRLVSTRGVNWRNRTLTTMVARSVHAFSDLWIRHSRTMRLSTVEALLPEEVFKEIRSFIQKYGHDLFHARMMMIGNMRAILHNGVDAFLDHLSENDDPVRPSPVLEALRRGRISRDEAENSMELVYGAVVDKFERFLEYNTTTTQSDYGEMLYCLLDFLRIEAAYDRDAWELAPENVAHELLMEAGRRKAATLWERLFQQRTEGKADRHVKALQAAERTHGMRLPSMSDHLNERFVKPMAVNRMTALVPRIVHDFLAGAMRSQAFEALLREVAEYVATTSGSGIDVPAWLRTLEREVDRALDASGKHRDPHEAEVRLAPKALTLRQTHRQLDACRKLVEQLLERKRS